jgi:hypothetical protein
MFLENRRYKIHCMLENRVEAFEITVPLLVARASVSTGTRISQSVPIAAEAWFNIRYLQFDSNGVGGQCRTIDLTLFCIESSTVVVHKKLR